MSDLVNRSKTNLPWEEWDWSQLPKEDQEVVWDHESRREAHAMAEREGEIDAWDPKLLCDIVKGLEDNGWDEHYQFAPIQAAPWNSLREAHRQVIRAHHKSRGGKFVPAGLDDSDSDCPLDEPIVCLSAAPYDATEREFRKITKRRRYTQNHSGSTLHLFEIRHLPHLDSKKAILQGFSRWLDENYPGIPKQQSGIGIDPECRLLDLAIYRLITLAKLKRKDCLKALGGWCQRLKGISPSDNPTDTDLAKLSRAKNVTTVRVKTLHGGLVAESRGKWTRSKKHYPANRQG